MTKDELEKKIDSLNLHINFLTDLIEKKIEKNAELRFKLMKLEKPGAKLASKLAENAKN
mgnify:FL=1